MKNVFLAILVIAFMFTTQGYAQGEAPTLEEIKEIKADYDALGQKINSMVAALDDQLPLPNVEIWEGKELRLALDVDGKTVLLMSQDDHGLFPINDQGMMDIYEVHTGKAVGIHFQRIGKEHYDFAIFSSGSYNGPTEPFQTTMELLRCVEYLKSKGYEMSGWEWQ